MELSLEMSVIVGIISLLIFSVCVDLIRRYKRNKRISEYQARKDKEYHLATIKTTEQMSQIDFMIRGGSYVHFTINVFGIDHNKNQLYYITVKDKYDRIISQHDSREDPTAELMYAFATRCVNVETFGLGIQAFSYNLKDKENKE